MTFPCTRPVVEAKDVSRINMRASLRDVRRLALEMRERYPNSRELQRYATLILDATRDVV